MTKKSKRIRARLTTAKLRRIKSKVTNKLKEEPLISKAQRWEKELLSTISKVHQVAHEDFVYLRNKVRKLKKDLAPAVGAQRDFMMKELEKAKDALDYLSSHRGKMVELKKWFSKLQKAWRLKKPRRAVKIKRSLKGKVRRKVSLKKAAVRKTLKKAVRIAKKASPKIKLRSRSKANRKTSAKRRKSPMKAMARRKPAMRSKTKVQKRDRKMGARRRAK